jgi:hypothetical protein
MNRPILFLAFTLTACGGSLKYTVDDNTVASCSNEERAPINAIRDERNRADDELRSAKSMEQSAESELSLAENEYKSAKLAKDSAKVSRQAAEQSGDFNRKNKAERDYAAADKAQDAGDAKVTWLEKKVKYAKLSREAAEAHVAQVNARIELEKARLCQTKGIRPSEKFDIMNYQQQSTETEQKFNDARRKADDKKADVDDRERRYMTAKQAADTAKANAGGS